MCWKRNNVRTRENVWLMGYEELVRRILMIRVVLSQGVLCVRRRPGASCEDVRQLPSGRNEYLPPMPVSMTDPLQRLAGGNRQSWRAAYPGDLFCLRATRFAVS